MIKVDGKVSWFPSSRLNPMSSAEINPYRTPDSASAATSRFLAINTTKLTWHETWRCSPNIFVYLVLVVLKLLRIRVAPSLAILPEQQTIELSKLSPALQAKLTAFNDQAGEVDYHLQQMLQTPLLGRGEAMTAVYHSVGKNAILCVDFLRDEQSGVEKQRPGFSTMLVDGTQLLTANVSPELDPPRSCQAAYFSRIPLAALLEQHERRVREQTTAVEPLLSFDDCDALARWLERLQLDDLQARGVIEPISDSDYTRLVRSMSQQEPISPRWRAITNLVYLMLFIALLALYFIPELTVQPAGARLWVLLLLPLAALIGLLSVWPILRQRSSS